MISDFIAQRLTTQLVKSLNDIQAWAELSQTCKRKAVGCGIFRLNRLAYSDEMIRTHNGPSAIGHECSGEVGKCGCAHAEPRAILNVMRYGLAYPRPHQPLVLVCKYSPCSNCANIINDSKIIRAVLYDVLTEHDTRGVALLKNHGISVWDFNQLNAFQLNSMNEIGRTIYADIAKWF